MDEDREQLRREIEIMLLEHERPASPEVVDHFEKLVMEQAALLAEQMKEEDE